MRRRKWRHWAPAQTDFLTKPFSSTELHVRIKNLVDSHQYQIKLSKQNTVLENTIEQLKDTETQLVQTEKLASLGRMSAGIIHEFNNPLNFATTGLLPCATKANTSPPSNRMNTRKYSKTSRMASSGSKPSYLICELSPTRIWKGVTRWKFPKSFLLHCGS